MSLIEIAKKFATEKHEGQFRFDGVTPYIKHPEDVARRVSNSYSAIGDAVAAAWLHDIFEDTDATKDNLYKLGFPDDVVTAVAVLTKRDGEDYKIYLERVFVNPIARKVKIADMLSNLSDSPSRKQVKKYAEGLTFLLNGLI